MQNKIVDHIRRHPGRTKGDVNFIGGKVRTDQFFQGLNVGIKVAVVGFVGLQRQSVFVHQVAGEVFVSGFPAFVKALVPVEGILKNAAL